MSKLFSLTVALIATTFVLQSSSHAQIYGQGFQFGAGIQAGGLGNFGGFYRPIPREQPPYFAQFPPVYYSHIVPRPYGVSPYAVPPGIAPIEMCVPAAIPHPSIIKNPHFNGEAIEERLPPVESNNETEKSDQPKAESASFRKTSGWIKNPHYTPREPMVASN